MKRRLNQWLAYSVLVLAVSGWWGCAKPGETPTTPTDQSISDGLKASLSSDPQLSAERVAVTVNNGEVTLSGQVSSDAAHLQAYKLANETAGVKKVNDLITEIAAASQEQAQGIEQVSTAVAQMDKVTQQNAANSEESASAAEEMSSQSEELQAMVGQFALSQTVQKRVVQSARHTQPESKAPKQMAQATSSGKKPAKRSDNGSAKGSMDEMFPMNEEALKSF